MSPLSLYQSEFITTFTGKRVNVLALRPEDICIEDVAHALSLLCRFTGHVRKFYSVAEHCLTVAAYVPPEFALEGLLHDAAEAYVNDLSRPVKHHPTMSAYRVAEQLVDSAVRSAFGLRHYETEPFMSPTVKDVDNRLVVTEARCLLAESSWTAGHAALPHTPHGYVPGKAEQLFLQEYRRLTR